MGSCGGPPDTGFPGILERDRIELIAESSEPVVEVFAREGDKLHTDQPILQLDSRRLQARRDEAAGARDLAAAHLAELKRGPRPETIEEARAKLRGAESEAATAEKELQRTSALVHKGLATREALDTAQAQRDLTRSERDASKAALGELLAGSTAEELQQAEAALAQAQAGLQALEISLERLQVRAPRQGLLDNLPFKLGEQPQTGATVAVMLAGSAPYARVYVPEPQRARLGLNSPALVRVDGIAEPFQGHVRMASRDPAFTPYYSLTERDRSRLSFLFEVTLEGEHASELPAGVPLNVEFQPTTAPQP